MSHFSVSCSQLSALAPLSRQFLILIAVRVRILLRIISLLFLASSFSAFVQSRQPQSASGIHLLSCAWLSVLVPSSSQDNFTGVVPSELYVVLGFQFQYLRLVKTTCRWAHHHALRCAWLSVLVPSSSQDNDQLIKQRTIQVVLGFQFQYLRLVKTTFTDFVL